MRSSGDDHTQRCHRQNHRKGPCDAASLLPTLAWFQYSDQRPLCSCASPLALSQASLFSWASAYFALAWRALKLASSLHSRQASQK